MLQWRQSPHVSGAHPRGGAAAWAIPSPSSRRPDQRAERDGSSGGDLPPLEAAREVCSADGADDGAREGARPRASSIPEPEAPPPEARDREPYED